MSYGYTAASASWEWLVEGYRRALARFTASADVASVEAGSSLEDAAREAGVGPRSVRPWRAEGRRELDALSAEARLELALERPSAEYVRNRPGPSPVEPDWREAALLLETQFPER